MLKKVLFFIIALVSLNGFAQQQVAGKHYEMEMEQERLSCYLDFVDNDDYYIEISCQEAIDIVYVDVLSYGKYKIEDRNVVLMDALHEYQMEMTLADDTLLLQKGFGFMEGKNYVFQGVSSRTDIPVATTLNKANIQEERDRYNVQNKELHNLTYGRYKAIKFQFFLDLDENKTYKYCFGYKGCPLSKGTWERNGNVLNLYDPSLDCTFYLLIEDDNRLISKFLPGDNTNDGLAFRVVKTPGSH